MKKWQIIAPIGIAAAAAAAVLAMRKKPQAAADAKPAPAAKKPAPAAQLKTGSYSFGIRLQGRSDRRGQGRLRS